jgi:uncharacterized protein
MSSATAYHAFTDADTDAVDQLLFDARWAESALDFYGFHGAITANCLAPTSLNRHDLFILVSGQEDYTPLESTTLFDGLVDKLERSIRSTLDLDDNLPIPPPLEADPEQAQQALTNWCAGFVDVYLQHEDDWLADNHPNTVSLLMPILTLSQAFDDDDFVAALNNKKLCRQMAQAIPDNIKDLYLHFHAGCGAKPGNAKQPGNAKKV